jgi:Tol biopolymer transport system component
MLRGLSLLLLLAFAASPAEPPHYRHPIVFCRGHGDVKSKIWIMEEDGSGMRQLTSGANYDDHPSLYSDLRHVLYSEFREDDFKPEKGARLIRLDIYTGERQVLAEVPGCALHHASLSPIQDLLAYHHDCGKRLSQWVGWEPGYEVNTVASNGVALPDGIIFMHEKNRGMPGARGVSIARMVGRGVGAKMIFLTDDQHLNRRPAVSPDGKQFAWQTDLAGKEDEIFLANIDGTNPRNLTNAPGNDGHPWFSRDGKTLVFESDRTGTMEIWKLDLRTLHCTQLTFGGKKYESDRPRM